MSENKTCWCGGSVGERFPGDEDGLGCHADLYHEWREAPVDTAALFNRRKFAECGYTLAHSSEDTGGLVQGGYERLIDASKDLSRVLLAQRGAAGVTVYRNHDSDVWRVNRRETLTEYRTRMGWVG